MNYPCFYSIIVVTLLLVGCAIDENERMDHFQKNKSNLAENKGKVKTSSHGDEQPFFDDLSWLVGRWRCVAREYLQPPYKSAAGNELFEYLNVYFPYADDKPHLLLTDNPEDRQIAALLLARDYIKNGRGEFVERLREMVDSCPVYIGKAELWAGYPDHITFEYTHITNVFSEQLILKSIHTKYILEKLPEFTQDDMARDFEKTDICAPIRRYTPEQIHKIRTEYENLKTDQRLKH